MKRGYRKAIFAVCYSLNRNRVIYLVLKRKLHWKGWEFPKGGIKNEESLIKTVRREVKEETGQTPIKIIKFGLEGEYKYKKLYLDRPKVLGQTYQLFSCKLKNKKIKLDKLEHSMYKWLEYKKAIKILRWGNQKKCLKLVNNYLKYGGPRFKARH